MNAHKNPEKAFKNPEGMILRLADADDIADGVPNGNYVGQFQCPECGAWVASMPGHSWTAASDEGVGGFITDLEPSVNLPGPHERKYPMSKKDEPCGGWHGWFRGGKWTT